MPRTWLWVPALVGIGALAFVLLATTSSSTPTMVGSDEACATMRTIPTPGRAPDRELSLPLAAGEPFTLSQPPGMWWARLDAEGTRFAHAPDAQAPGTPPVGRAWTDVQDVGWCRARPAAETFVAEGDGTLRIRAWTGDDVDLRPWPR